MEKLGEIAPAVTVANFLAATHMPAAGGDEIAIEIALNAAEAMVTTASGRPLTVGQYRFELPAGWSRWWVPVLPVVQVVQIEAQDDVGVWSDLALGSAILRDAYSAPLLEMEPVQASRLRITVEAGYAVNAPAQLRQAIILLAKEWFDAGIAVEGQGKLEMNFGALRLVRQVRYRVVTQFEWVG
jgi:uncharacterized phiE125 gp8 family phage protein